MRGFRDANLDGTNKPSAGKGDIGVFLIGARKRGKTQEKENKGAGKDRGLATPPWITKTGIMGHDGKIKQISVLGLCSRRIGLGDKVKTKLHRLRECREEMRRKDTDSTKKGRVTRKKKMDQAGVAGSARRYRKWKGRRKTKKKKN